MKSLWSLATIAFFVLASCFAVRCPAQELSEREQMEELRREVADLRKAIAELTKRLEGQEYQQLPRLETVAPAEATRVAAPLPKHFRFPINIERGTAIPVWSTRDRWRH